MHIVNTLAHNAAYKTVAIEYYLLLVSISLTACSLHYMYLTHWMASYTLLNITGLLVSSGPVA
jgi:hypothetical protein